jgi:hypothetical protein
MVAKFHWKLYKNVQKCNSKSVTFIIFSYSLMVMEYHVLSTLKWRYLPKYVNIYFNMIYYLPNIYHKYVKSTYHLVLSCMDSEVNYRIPVWYPVNYMPTFGRGQNGTLLKMILTDIWQEPSGHTYLMTCFSNVPMAPIFKNLRLLGLNLTFGRTPP